MIITLSGKEMKKIKQIVEEAIKASEARSLRDQNILKAPSYIP